MLEAVYTIPLEILPIIIDVPSFKNLTFFWFESAIYLKLSVSDEPDCILSL